MASLADVRNDIKSELEIHSTVYDSDIDRAIRSAIQSKRGRRMYFLQGASTVILTTGTSNVTLPSDYGALMDMRLLADSYYYTAGRGFDQRSYEELLRKYRLSVKSGKPENYAIWNGSIYTDKSADKDYTIDLTYWKKDSQLPTADTDTSVWLTDESDFYIKASAKVIFKRDHRLFNATNDDIFLEKTLWDDLLATNLLYEGE